MQKILKTIVGLLILSACNNADTLGKFTVVGNIKNIENQKVYVEELYFNDKNPAVLDTAEIKNGSFKISAKASEEGLYRLRFEKQPIGYIFINDKSNINFTADAKDITLQGADFKTPANTIFKSFLSGYNDRQKNMNDLSRQVEDSKALKVDTSNDTKISLLNNAAIDLKNYIIKSIDTIADPVVAMFALGYTRGIDPEALKTVVPNLAKRFPTHNGIAGIITQYNAMMVKKDLPKQTPQSPIKKLGIGNIAPEITMADTSGQKFSLSSLKGKYVLIDFWASWCAPCRGENPNVVANYTKYKNKNFTILGVSLDEDKTAWAKAIVKDKLAWKQISDLKGWACAATTTYGFDAIPYNVLIDPSGKIIATELRENELGKKLAEVLK